MKTLTCLSNHTQGRLIQHMSGLQSGIWQLPRSYHNLEHIGDMQQTVGDFGCGEEDFRAMHLAIWFHDLYYDSRATNGENEDKSCDLVDVWFRRYYDLATLANREATLKDRVKAYIQRTKTHELLPSDEVVGGDPAPVLNAIALARFLRADLNVFTKHTREYWIYLLKLRKEYSWVGDQGWRKGRGEFLEKMLARPRILPYGASESYGSGPEEQARVNLITELTAIRENKSYLQWEF